jgi:hypothetical protein
MRAFRFITLTGLPFPLAGPTLILSWPEARQRALCALRLVALGGLVLALAALAACSPVSSGSVEAVRLAVHGETVHPTPESVAASPYFQLQANGPDGEAILVLGKVEDGRLGWYGQGDDIVFTRDGQLIKTVGLPQNLDGLSITGGKNPFETGLQHVTSPITYTRTMDWSPGYRYGNAMQATLTPGGMDTVEILGTRRSLRRYDEHLSGPAGSFTNRYWVDPADGFIWKSRQYVAPGFPLELIQLRPYTGKAS